MDGTRMSPAFDAGHSHVFLAEGHARAERRTWMVIGLCATMMVLEIIGGLAFGSIALVADGLHMSTHAGALLLAALAYSFARRHANDPRFSFGTGKLGDLAGFTSAIVLAMIALLIGYEAVTRFFAPVPIDFAEALPIAALGLGVNVASVWLLSDTDHHHSHSHSHSHGGHDYDNHDQSHAIATPDGALTLCVFEDGVPPAFRITRPSCGSIVTIETVRPSGERQSFEMADQGVFLQSTSEIPEPHQFTAHVHVGDEVYSVAFAEHAHVHAHAHTHASGGASHRDNNMRAAIVHVIADAAVSVLVIFGLILARAFGWLWIDPLVGIVGACVIASWSLGLIRDTGSILLDMVPDQKVAEGVRETIEANGDRLADLHLWRLGPGHLGAIVSVVTRRPREPNFYREQLANRYSALSHVTVEVMKAAN